MAKPKILVITGSTRPGRNGDKVAAWYREQADGHPDLDFEYVDLAAQGLPMLDEQNPPSMHQYEREHTKKWAEIVGSADGYVWISPEYNHGVPASLKNAIDFVYQEWNRKPVALVTYGGGGMGLRAAEQWRLIAAELQMHSIRGQIFMNIFNGTLKEDGSIDGSTVQGDVKAQLDELTWWTTALKTAREQ